MSQPPNRAWVERESFIEAFESAFAADAAADLANFLPQTDHPLRLPVLEELVRIDLEHHWRRGEPRWLEDYFHRFPELYETSAAIRTLAFEEYRLRRRAGEPVLADEYRARFGIDPTRGIRDDQPDLGAATGTPVPVLDRFAQLLTTLPRVGDRFLDYRLEAELGSGAFGQVFLATPAGGGERVAIKIAPLVGAEPPALARLRHPNIVPILDVFHSGNTQSVVMPYRGAVTLGHALQKIDADAMPALGAALFRVIRPGLPAACQQSDVRDRLASASYTDAAIWLVARLADGLSYAHSQGLLHRDLKPANVLIDDAGTPMLLDFNLATAMPRGESATAPSPAGTLPYMSPEQLEEFLGYRRTIDGRSDLYSLGVILYQLLTGRMPYPSPHDLSGERLAATLQLRYRPAPSIRKSNPSLSCAAEEMVSRLLEAKPERRPGDAVRVRNELTAIVSHLNIGSLNSTA